MIPLILSRLIESNYQIYFPLFKSNIILVQRLGLTKIERCAVMNASQDKDNTPLIKLNRISDDKVDLICVCDPISRTVWSIPISSLENRKVIRLGSRYEEYVIPEPMSKTFQEQKAARIEKLKRLREEAQGIANNQNIKNSSSTTY